ncbi:MAG TPA: hypothetical protein VFF10_03065 [Trueperaceae bacterium]|nr:hypothetical protein [Trueperaceae bacterium]
MRRPSQLRLSALLGALAAVVFALIVSYLVSLLVPGPGRLGFGDFNAAGLLEGAVFVFAYSTALIWVRSALRIPSPALLSFGLSGPPAAGTVAMKVPVVDATSAVQTLMDNRMVIVHQDRVPIGVTGLHHDRITSWEELVKAPADVAVTELRSMLAHEQLVVVMDGQEVKGIVTQEMYLAGLWGSIR